MEQNISRLSVRELSEAYDKYASQIDKTLAQIEAFLQNGESESAQRADFERAQAAAQAEEFSPQTDTARNLVRAAQSGRARQAEQTDVRAQASGAVQASLAAAQADRDKAAAQLRTAQNKARISAEQSGPEDAASEYRRYDEQREFERKREKDAYARLLAERKAYYG